MVAGLCNQKLFCPNKFRVPCNHPNRQLRATSPACGKSAHSFPVARPRSANTMRHIVTNLAADIRDALPRRFSELAVFDARLYIRVRRIDEPA